MTSGMSDISVQQHPFWRGYWGGSFTENGARCVICEGGIIPGESGNGGYRYLFRSPDAVWEALNKRAERLRENEQLERFLRMKRNIMAYCPGCGDMMQSEAPDGPISATDTIQFLCERCMQPIRIRAWDIRKQNGNLDVRKPEIKKEGGVSGKPKFRVGQRVYGEVCKKDATVLAVGARCGGSGEGLAVRADDGSVYRWLSDSSFVVPLDEPDRIILDLSVEEATLLYNSNWGSRCDGIPYALDNKLYKALYSHKPAAPTKLGPLDIEWRDHSLKIGNQEMTIGEFKAEYNRLIWARQYARDSGMVCSVRRFGVLLEVFSNGDILADKEPIPLSQLTAIRDHIESLNN